MSRVQGLARSRRAGPLEFARSGRSGGLELALFAAFAAVSLWLVGLDLWQVIVHGRVWTGTDGRYTGDQLQYLAWVRSAAAHLTAANLFVLRGTPADYLQPAIAVSGGLTAAGLAPSLALLVWKPVAVIAFYLAARAFIRRALPEAGRGSWLAALALTLFYGCVSDVYGHLGVLGDLFPGFLSWGYPFALLAAAAAAVALLAYADARVTGKRWLIPGVLGGLAGWLHPWQAEVLILTVLGMELARGARRTTEREPRTDARAARRERRAGARLSATTVALCALPLVYYAVLDHWDRSWRLAEQVSPHGFPAIATILALGPLATVALLGYRGPPAGELGRVVRIWPLAMVAVYIVSSTALGSAPLHALDGVTLPLSVLAVGGSARAGWWRGPRAGLIGGLVILVATVPATILEMTGARDDTLPGPGRSNFIQPDESRALGFLDRASAPGGVFTDLYLGAVVPGRTGRHTFVGHCEWSEPACQKRIGLSLRLLGDRLAPRRARSVLSASGARFVLSDCAHRRDLSGALGPLLASVHRFGCATVYELR